MLWWSRNQIKLDNRGSSVCPKHFWKLFKFFCFTKRVAIFFFFKNDFPGFLNQFLLILLLKLSSFKVRPHLHANTNEAGRGEAYANIYLDCNTRQNVVICRGSEWFSLKYQLQVDSVRSASDQTEAVFLSSTTRLHCYTCLASACLERVFVLMWTRLYSYTTFFYTRTTKTFMCLWKHSSRVSQFFGKLWSESKFSNCSRSIEIPSLFQAYQKVATLNNYMWFW